MHLGIGGWWFVVAGAATGISANVMIMSSVDFPQHLDLIKILPGQALCWYARFLSDQRGSSRSDNNCLGVSTLAVIRVWVILGTRFGAIAIRGSNDFFVR